MLSWGKEILRGHVARPKIEPVCGVMGVSASAYYQRATGERSRRRVEEARVLERIVHHGDELAVVEYIGWFNRTRLRESIDHLPFGRARGPLRGAVRSDSSSQSIEERSPPNPAPSVLGLSLGVGAHTPRRGLAEMPEQPNNVPPDHRAIRQRVADLRARVAELTDQQVAPDDI